MRMSVGYGGPARGSCDALPNFSARSALAIHHQNNLQSLHLNANSLPTVAAPHTYKGSRLPTPTRGRGRMRRESTSSAPLSPTSYTPHQRQRTHLYASPLSTLTIAPPPPGMNLVLLLCIDVLSVNQNYYTVLAQTREQYSSEHI